MSFLSDLVRFQARSSKLNFLLRLLLLSSPPPLLSSTPTGLFSLTRAPTTMFKLTRKAASVSPIYADPLEVQSEAAKQELSSPSSLLPLSFSSPFRSSFNPHPFSPPSLGTSSISSFNTRMKKLSGPFASSRSRCSSSLDRVCTKTSRSDPSSDSTRSLYR